MQLLVILAVLQLHVRSQSINQQVSRNSFRDSVLISMSPSALIHNVCPVCAACSGNDILMLQGENPAIVVGNSQPVSTGQMGMD